MGSREGSRERGMNERTPLLSSNNSGVGEVEAQIPASEEHEKLPMTQIVLLCFARITEPIAFFSIFPFINQMIQDAAGVAESEVGYYSGLIVRPEVSFEHDEGIQMLSLF